METSDLSNAHLQSIGARGLSSFLQAVAATAPEVNFERAGDCWLRALETTDWKSGESSDRFICRVTINALAMTGGHD